MKVVIVNDCAHVMEDIIPYLSSDFDVQFIQRTRGLWSKTFGILWSIAKSSGDIYHVSYALQDAYLTDKFKHLDILHVHGSDIRWTLHSKKWGWIVRHNLESATVVLYSTPDLEDIVKECREDAIYMPRPVKTDVFTLKEEYNNPPKAVYFKLPYEQLPLGFNLYMKENNIEVDILERNIPYEEMPKTLSQYDIFIDRFSIPSFSKTCLEAMACGLLVIRDYRSLGRVDELSLEKIRNEGKKNREFVERNHDVKLVANQLSKIWKEID